MKIEAWRSDLLVFCARSTGARLGVRLRSSLAGFQEAYGDFSVSDIGLTNGFNGQAVGAFPGVVEVIDGTAFGGGVLFSAT